MQMGQSGIHDGERRSFAQRCGKEKIAITK
jgi:hypothetical protein